MTAAFPSHVFVLCTGRCGSTTLARACGHLTNWTAGHESRTHEIGPARLAYPPRHIEVDNRLAWFLGRLNQSHGDRAAYVHLTRDPEAVARSFARRASHGIFRAYRTQVLARSARLRPDRAPLDAARDYVETVTANIVHFLADKSHVLPVRLESLSADGARFLDWIGAEGDLAAARATLGLVHNASKSPSP